MRPAPRHSPDDTIRRLLRLVAFRRSDDTGDPCAAKSRTPGTVLGTAVPNRFSRVDIANMADLTGRYDRT